MMICKECFTPMVGVMSFSKNKHEKFNRCPRCCGETKRQKLRDDELEFGEILSKYKSLLIKSQVFFEENFKNSI